jgi:hypothetical protein
MNKISINTGKSRTFIKRVALSNNISIKTLPRELTLEVNEKALLLGFRGFNRKEIAKRCGLSVGCVEQILSSKKQLVSWRKKCRYESKRRRCQLTIIKHMRENPSHIKQEVKKACYREFHWLYRNEKKWLNQNLPIPTKPQYRYKVDWENRDKQTASKIKAFLARQIGPISLSKLDMHLGGHDWMIKNKHRMPKSMAMHSYYNTNQLQLKLIKDA